MKILRGFRLRDNGNKCGLEMSIPGQKKRRFKLVKTHELATHLTCVLSAFDMRLTLRSFTSLNEIKRI
jgi:hypothetical protein